MSNANLCSKGYRIIVGWNLEVVDVLVVNITSQVMHVKITHKATKREILCTFVYAVNLPIERRKLWSDLDIHKNMVWGKAWVLLGDFNVALNLEDSFSSSSQLTSHMLEFKGAYPIFQPYRISDNSPAVLKIPDLVSSKPKPFKFCNFLTFKSSFLDIVSTFWNVQVDGHNLYQIASKLMSIKKPFRKLLHEQGNLHDRVNRLRHELDGVQKALDNNPADSNLRDEEAIYLKAFNKAKVDEERFLKQKTKIDWLDVGDSNSAYFHKSVKSGDICNAVRDFFSNDKLLKEIKHTFIALIPKVSTTQRVNDYRPIPCCNVLYKCISKILTNRIIAGIKEVVSENQSAFVPGRRIADNILITQELMHNYHRDRAPPRCAFKIDIQNTVDWRFLANILKCFGFHPTMIKWIMACIESSSFLISLNGDIHGFFKGKRGLRQRDPLSPYLFTLVMEVLTLIIRRRVRLSEMFHYHNHCEELQLVNVCFADDLFIFARGDVDTARVIMELIDEFKSTSGLVPSLPKSTTFFCNVCNHVKIAILNIMQFSEGKLSVKYLGV
ncbi:hypothetical protein Tco_0686868, partial [Tanacetum coccineum]